MEASSLQSLTLKQAFVNERNKMDKSERVTGFSFQNTMWSKHYKEDEQSKILRRFFSHLELCYCGMIFETEDRNHYKDYRPDHHFQSDHHKKFDRDYEYCSSCKSHELRDRHPCFNPMCECGERYNILHVYFSGPIFHENHKTNSARHHYLFDPEYLF